MKQYINNNKQILIIFIGAISFLFIHNEVYCHPMVLMLLGPTINYFSTISPEFYANKIIDKFFEYSPWIIEKTVEYTPYTIYGTGGLVLGTLGLAGGIKVAEYGYNWRFFANQYAQSTPVIGSVLRGYNFAYKWWYKKDLSNIEYTYFYPKVASALGYPDLFNKKLEVDLSTLNSNLTSREANIEYRDRTVFADTPISVYEFKDKPVYVPIVEYKDRENLLVLNEKVDKLAYATTESNLLKMGFANGYQQLKDELVSLVDDCNKSHPNSYIVELSYEDDLFITYKYKSGSQNCSLHEEFEYPLLKELLLTGKENNMFPYIKLNYGQRSLIYGGGLVFNADACQIGCNNPQIELPLFGEGIAYFIQNNPRFVEVQNEQDILVQDLRSSVNRGLLGVEVKDQSTQTATFDLNETLFDRINSFLEVRDETSFIVASHEGRNLPFNNMQIKSYSKPQEVSITQTQETSVETQTEPSINENIGACSMNTTNSSLFQNMGAMFSAALVWSVAHDFQTIELVARSLLGFIHIPEYNQAFLAATQMSIADLQMEYNFNYEEAKRAFDSIDFAREMRNTGSLPDDLSSYLSNSTQDVPTSINWSNIFFTGVLIVGTIGAGYLAWQAIKTGVPVESTSTNISAFEAEILKGLK